MTESAMWFDSTTYPANTFDDFFEDTLTAGLSTRAGVIRGVGGMLAVTGTSSPVSVADGAAVVKGKYYKNTSTISINVSNAASNTRIDRVILRLNYAAKTITTVLLSGTAAPSPTAPALTQVDGTTWEISLAQLLVTTGGVITVTSERRAAKGQGSWSKGDMLFKAATLSGHYPIDPDLGVPDYDWHLANGDNDATTNNVATPDARNKFIIAAGATYAAGTTGGSATGTLPTHAHAAGSYVAAVHNHPVNITSEKPAAYDTVADYLSYTVTEMWYWATKDHTHVVNGQTANNAAASTVSGTSGNNTTSPTLSVLNPYLSESCFVYIGPYTG